MLYLGRAIRRLAEQAGGQLILEVPDDLAPAIVEHFVLGANHGVAEDVPFALFVHSSRNEVTSRRYSVDFRELGEYRQGNNLAITYSSDNRAMATYTGVYQPLLSPGFPKSSSSGRSAGIAGLPEFSSALSEVLTDESLNFGLSDEDFRQVVESILSFLADAYEYAGNGQSSFAADWWFHISTFVDAITLHASHGQYFGTNWLYGCAGLPAPEATLALKQKAGDYVEILLDRWSDLDSIQAEVQRLNHIPSAAAGASHLSKIDWEKSIEESSLRSDSVIRKVALSSVGSTFDRISGWAQIGEREFKSFVPGRLVVKRPGVGVSAPWPEVASVLALTAGETVDKTEREFCIDSIEIVVPFRAEGARPTASQIQALAGDIQISGTGGCSIEWDCARTVISNVGLVMTGRLSVKLKKSTPHQLRVEASCLRVASTFFVDRCDTKITVLWVNDRAVWVSQRRTAKKYKEFGPVFSDEVTSSTEEIKIPHAGFCRVAVAVNDELSGRTVTDIEIGELSSIEEWGAGQCPSGLCTLDLLATLKILINGREIFSVDVGESAESHISPVIAAAYADPPNILKAVADGCWAHLERLMMKSLSEEATDNALGICLVEDSIYRVEPSKHESGALCSPRLSAALPQLTPGVPDGELLNHPKYCELRAAFLSLGIMEEISRLQDQHRVDGITVSRISLSFISSEKIEKLQAAYFELLKAAPNFKNRANRFWARNPFSVVVYPKVDGLRTAKAVLLSPLHPLRLSWLWKLQVGLRQAALDGVSAAVSLGIIDGSSFPAYSVVEGAMNTHPFIPVVIDPRPADVYIGWHASVRIIDGQPSVPGWIDGRRFPIDGLSALSRDSVLSAISDFQRVVPHAQTLRIELASVNETIRSTAVDDGVITKIQEIAQLSAGFDGVSGIRVFDSPMRKGSPPNLAEIGSCLSVAGPSFNVEWVIAGPGSERPHVTFLEGANAMVGMERFEQAPVGFVPEIPLRRTPRRFSRRLGNIA